MLYLCVCPIYSVQCKVSQCKVCSVQFVVKELTSPPTDATSGHHKCSGGGATGSAKITSALASSCTCTWSPQLGHHKFLRGVSRGSLVQRLLLLVLPSVPVVNLRNLQRRVVPRFSFLGRCLYQKKSGYYIWSHCKTL